MKTTALLRTRCTNFCGGSDCGGAFRCVCLEGPELKPAASNMPSLFCTGLHAITPAHTAKDIRVARMPDIGAFLLIVIPGLLPGTILRSITKVIDLRGPTVRRPAGCSAPSAVVPKARVDAD